MSKPDIVQAAFEKYLDGIWQTWRADRGATQHELRYELLRSAFMAGARFGTSAMKDAMS